MEAWLPSESRCGASPLFLAVELQRPATTALRRGPWSYIPPRPRTHLVLLGPLSPPPTDPWALSPGPSSVCTTWEASKETPSACAAWEKGGTRRPDVGGGAPFSG